MEQDLGGEVYTVYADVETADVYTLAAYHGAKWRAAATDTKAQALITATRLLDRQVWITAYNTFALRAVEQNIINASIELGIALLDGSEVQSNATNAERVRSMSAGSVSITNFRAVDAATRFPQIVHELLRGYMGTSTFYVPKATGVADETSFPIDLGFSVGGL
jgi:hypothetical protein